MNVAHFRTPFLSLSETFIYAYLTHLTHVSPVVFTAQRANSTHFPFDPVVCYEFKKFSWKGLTQRIASRFTRSPQAPLQRLLKARHIDLLHAHFGPEGWALLDVKKKLDLPLITAFYGYDASYIGRQPLWRERYTRLFKEGDVFLAEGPQMRKKLEELGCPSEKIHLQRIAVNVEKIPFRLRKVKKPAKTRFLFCGRFVEKKGLIPALQAFRDLRNTGVRNFEFRIIGDGELMPKVHKFIFDEKLEDCVQLLGAKNHSDFYDELDQADVFVAPSVVSSSGDSEGGAPTTILEAQAAGLPVVTTYHDDIPFIVVRDRSALLSAENDIGGLKRNLLFFMENPDAIPFFGRAGRDHVERRHNILHEARKLESLYSSLYRLHRSSSEAAEVSVRNVSPVTV